MQPSPYMPRAEIAAAMGVKSTDLSMVRRSLMDKGLIDAPRYGQLAFTVPGFDAYIRQLRDG